MLKVEDLYPIILETLSSGKTFLMPIKGTSMQPMLHTGDIVELAPIDNIKKNDIIFYKRSDGSFVLHRVYKVEKDSYTMIGDHQIVLEKNVLRDDCFAKVISYTKKNKKRKLKGIRYGLYLFSLRFFLVRRFYIKCLH